MIKPANRRLLYEEIIKQIIDIIKNGQWKLGEQIPGEIQLAGDFQVSRNVIREALKSLELNDILSTKSGRGTYVSNNALRNIRKMELFSMLGENSSIEELMETRLVMEVELVYKATLRAKEADLEKLQEIIKKSKKAVVDGTYSEDMGMEFHLFIAQIARNRIMEKFLNSITDQLLVQRSILLLKHSDGNELLRELDEHEKIFNYIKEGLPEKAKEAMYLHLSKAEDILEKRREEQDRNNAQASSVHNES
ncbi:MAG: FadR family transcriptional regulator [Clostridiales bacterium]|nr:FadR family transcriptional regulator [Clostridiales bacterium]MCF8023687.1 FadR family transcriptional regulator [Clostridiales bacterium]